MFLILKSGEFGQSPISQPQPTSSNADSESHPSASLTPHGTVTAQNQPGLLNDGVVIQINQVSTRLEVCYIFVNL